MTQKTRNKSGFWIFIPDGASGKGTRGIMPAETVSVCYLTAGLACSCGVPLRYDSSLARLQRAVNTHLNLFSTIFN
jgi:hypothetical protein